jgi:hypothetical protein
MTVNVCAVECSASQISYANELQNTDYELYETYSQMTEQIQDSLIFSALVKEYNT